MLQPNKKKVKPNPIKKYKKTSTGDTLAEDIFEVIDPTGISSYDDVYRSYNENGLFSWQTGLEVLGALPIIGKAGKGLKAAQMANKYAKGLIKTNKVAKRVERVLPEILKAGKKVGKTFAKASRAGGANPIAATATIVGKGAETLQKVTKAVEKGTSKVVKQAIKINPANKKIINEAVATVNTANTLSDATGLVKDQVVTPIINDVKENIEESSYVPIPDKKEKKEFSWKDLEPKDFQKKNLAYGTGEDGINPNIPWLPPSSSIYQDPNFDFLNQIQEPIDFSKPQLESQGFADIGVNKNTSKFNVGSGINFNPESLAARVGASFNDKGFNSALNYTQGERGFSEVNVNAGYGNDSIQGKVDYSKTNNGDSLLGNLNIGDDKLRLLLSYLKDSEGTNLKGGLKNTINLKGGLLNNAIEFDTNFEDPKISGKVNYTNPTGKLNLNAGASYSEGEKANFNAGLNYSFALGTDKNGIGDPPVNMFKTPSIPQVDYVEPTYSYPEREPYPSELEFFKGRPDVGGMATEDKHVIINPYSPLSKEQKDYVRKIEQGRLAMLNGYKRPTFDLTDKQKKFYSTIYDGKPYSEDIQDIRETIASRIMVGDESAQDITPEQQEYADKLAKVLKYSYGTNSQGIMKNKMNPRKKYANGSDAKGMNVNNYVISPAEAMNDYNIMMAKVQQKAMSNPWLPVVAAVGGIAQNFVGNASMLTKGAGGFSVTGSAPDTTNPAFQSPIGDRYKTAANGMNNIQADVEVEGGEMYETPQGQVGEFEGPSHEEEGIPLEMTQDPNANIAEGEVQEGTKVYSDRLKIQGKTLAERKEKRERLIANLEDTVSEPLVDQAIKNASKRKMMAIQKEEVADLDFQEKVNNIQQMADTMVAAFGTSMAGLQANPMEESMEYGYGSGMNGVQKMVDGGIAGDPPYGINNPMYGNEQNQIKNLQMFLGVDPDGKPGKKTQAAWAKYQDPEADITKKEYLYPWDTWKGKTSEDEQSIYTTMGLTPGGRQFQEYIDLTPVGRTDQDKMTQEQPINFIKPTVEYEEPEVPPSIEGVVSELSKRQQRKQDEADQALKWKQNDAITEDTTDNETYKLKKSVLNESEENKPGTMFSRGLEKIGGVGGGGGMPGIGDLTKLVGNYLGMTSGIKTANEQRATDVTKTNVYKNAGEESQRLLDNAKKGIEISKAQAIVKANTNTRTGRKGARNSARGVNQMRAMDWLYDTALNQQVADISAGAAQQMSGIDVQKSGVAMNADQLEGAGEWQATMANDADKDAYYTALALGRKDFATGMQQSGKDLNSMKENKIVEGLMKQYGTYFSGSNSGVAAKSFEEITGQNKKEEIFLGPDGKTKFKLGKDNKLIQVTA